LPASARSAGAVTRASARNVDRRRRIRGAGRYAKSAVRQREDLDMSTSRNLIVLAALACLIAAPASAQLVQRKDLSYAIAKTIAENALEDCKARGYAVSVVVVDRGGNTVVALRGDNASVHTMENARRKAYTAMTFKMTTEDFIKDMATRPVRREQTTLPNVIAIGGGVPIKVGNDVIGGVGLSGSPGVDEPCVNAGMDKVKNQLQ
ncbi:MAG TPA: heme-binding protein, partial [Xanthobacteraceae bacterium]|nr:heme-binding protein [Xanthobacteraceae bacterium]